MNFSAPFLVLLISVSPSFAAPIAELDLAKRQGGPTPPQPGMMWFPFQQPAFQVPPGFELVKETPLSKAQKEIWAFLSNGGWKKIFSIGKEAAEPTTTSDGQPVATDAPSRLAEFISKFGKGAIQEAMAKKAQPKEEEKSPRGLVLGQGAGMWVPASQPQNWGPVPPNWAPQAGNNANRDPQGNAGGWWPQQGGNANWGNWGPNNNNGPQVNSNGAPSGSQQPPADINAQQPVANVAQPNTAAGPSTNASAPSPAPAQPVAQASTPVPPAAQPPRRRQP